VSAKFALAWPGAGIFVPALEQNPLPRVSSRPQRQFHGLFPSEICAQDGRLSQALLATHLHRRKWQGLQLARLLVN
jgi:hypothetical protein